MKRNPLANDTLFKTGRKCLSEKMYDDAIGFFCELMQQKASEFGDGAVECAPAWFEYGNALLTKEENSESDDLLGKSAAEARLEAKKAAETLGKILTGEAVEKDNDEEDEGSEDEDEEGGDDAEADDLQIAWESLEMARKIYEEHAGSDTDLQLSDVQVRLGDVQIINNNFEEAICDYNKSLAIRQSICESSDRLIADVHFSLALAYVYNSKGKTGADAITDKSEALKNYKLARQSIEAWLTLQSTNSSEPSMLLASTPCQSSSASSASAPASVVDSASSSSSDSTVSTIMQEILERREFVEEITESIDAMEAEIQTLRQESALSSSSSSSASAPVTTIGFSAPRTSHTTIGFGGAAPIVANDYFTALDRESNKRSLLSTTGATSSSSSSSSSSSATSLGPAPLMVKKKKVGLIGAAAAAAVSEPQSISSSSSSDAASKAPV